MKTLDAERVMDEAGTYMSGISYVTKVAKYAEDIACVPNKHNLKLPELRTMPKVKRITFAITMVVDVTLYDITYRTSVLWTSVEELINDLVEGDYPLEDITIVPGNIEYVRMLPDTGEETEVYVLEDRNEATHSAYYRRFGYDTIYIPWCMYRKKFHLHLPKYLAATVVQEGHGKSITYWDDGPASSMGRLLLDFH